MVDNKELIDYCRKLDDSMEKVNVISQRVDVVSQRVEIVDQIVGQHGDQLNHIENTLYPKIEDQSKPFSVSLSSNPVVDELRQINNWLQQINTNLSNLEQTVRSNMP